MNMTAKQATAIRRPITTSSARGDGSPGSTIRSRRCGRTATITPTTRRTALQTSLSARMMALPTRVTAGASSWLPQARTDDCADADECEPRDGPGHHSLGDGADMADPDAAGVGRVVAAPDVGDDRIELAVAQVPLREGGHEVRADPHGLRDLPGRRVLQHRDLGVGDVPP